MSITLDAHTCPRCLGGIPSNERRGEYIGALSRTDNETYICSACGTLEALEQFFDKQLMPQSEWLCMTSMFPPNERSQPLTVVEDATEGAI